MTIIRCSRRSDTQCTVKQGTFKMVAEYSTAQLDSTLNLAQAREEKKLEKEQVLRFAQDDSVTTRFSS